MNMGSHYKRDPHHHLVTLPAVLMTGLHMHPELSLSYVTCSTEGTRCPWGKSMIYLKLSMNAMTSGEGPFKTHKDLCNTINAMNLGDTP